MAANPSPAHVGRVAHDAAPQPSQMLDVNDEVFNLIQQTIGSQKWHAGNEIDAEFVEISDVVDGAAPAQIAARIKALNVAGDAVPAISKRTQRLEAIISAILVETQQSTCQSLVNLVNEMIVQEICTANEVVAALLNQSQAFEPGLPLLVTCRAIIRFAPHLTLKTAAKAVVTIAQLLMKIKTPRVTPQTAAQLALCHKSLHALVMSDDAPLPPYLALNELRDMAMISVASPTLWPVGAFFDFINQRRFDLQKLLVVTDYTHRRCIVSYARFDDFVAYRRAWQDRRHQVLSLPPSPWVSTETTYHLLAQWISVDRLMALKFVDEEANRRTAQVSIREALAHRILFLVAERERERQSGVNVFNTAPLDKVYAAWWPEWVSLADQLFDLMRRGVVDLVELAGALVSSNQARDNGVVWLLAQNISTEEIQKQQLNPDRPLRLLEYIFALYNADQNKYDGKFHPRENAFAAVSQKWKAVASEKGEKLKLPKAMEDLSVDDKINKWYESRSAEGTLNFQDLKDFETAGVGTLSISQSSAVTASVVRHLTTPEERPARMPYNLATTGRNHALGMALITSLGMRCRQAIGEVLERAMCDAQIPAAPSVVETYARLVYSAPNSLRRDTPNQRHDLTGAMLALTHGEKDRPSHIHTIVELFSYRLVRIMRQQSMERRILLDVMAFASRINSWQMYQSCEALLWKLLSVLPNFKLFASKELKDLGEGWLRAIAFNMGRSIVVRGVSDYGQLASLQPLLETIRKGSVYTWSPQTMRFFPVEMQQYYFRDRSPAPALPHSDQVVSTSNTFIATLLNQRVEEWPNLKSNQKVSMVTSGGVGEKALFFAAVYVSLQTTGISAAGDNIGQNAKSIRQHMERSHTVCDAIYRMVEFVLEAADLQTTLPAQVGYTLSLLVWRYGILSFSTVLSALADSRRDSQIGLDVIDYLLFNDADGFRVRVDGFLELKLSPDWWYQPLPVNDQLWTTKIAEYHEKFPDMTLPNHAEPLPIYYSCEPLRMLPVLDMLLGRMLEFGRTDSIHNMVTQYANLWLFHDSPVTFVRDTLFYYNECEDLRADVRKAIAGIAWRADPSLFSDGFKAYMESSSTSRTQFDADEVITRMSTFHHIGHETRSVVIAYPTGTKPFHYFHEFPATPAATVTATTIELLCLPRQSALDASLHQQSVLADLVAASLRTVALGGTKGFDAVGSLGILIAALPNCFHVALCDRVAQCVSSDQLLMDPEPSILSECVFNDFRTNAARATSNVPNALLALFSGFVREAGVVALGLLPGLVMNCRPLSTATQLLFVFRLVAPAVYRISGNAELLLELVSVLLNCMVDVAQSRALHPSIEYSVPPCMEPIVDLMLHVALVLPQRTSVTSTLTSTINQLPAPLRMRLRTFGQDTGSPPAPAPSPMVQATSVHGTPSLHAHGSSNAGTPNAHTPSMSRA